MKDNEQARKDLENIKEFLKERGLYDEPCKKKSKYTIGDIVDDFAYLVDKSIRSREDQTIITKHNKEHLSSSAYSYKQYKEREKYMESDEFKAKYTSIIPYKTTFSVWEEIEEEEDGWIYEDSWPYEYNNCIVELEHIHPDWVNSNWHIPLIDLCEKLSIDDLVEAE
tara:strand:- start:64 stop:564 length:501 start_codon:yes stop_codon:yes gene_type:complete